MSPGNRPNRHRAGGAAHRHPGRRKTRVCDVVETDAELGARSVLAAAERRLTRAHLTFSGTRTAPVQGPSELTHRVCGGPKRLDGSKLRSGHFKSGKQVGEWTTYD